MYDLLVNAECVERATAMHWNYSGDELGIMQFVEGDPDAFRDAVEEVSEVVDYELTVAGTDAFYVYIRDATNRRLRELFDLLDRSPVVVIPPVEYSPDGSVSYSVFGPSSAIQSVVEEIPEPIRVTVTGVGSIAAVPSAVETTLSDRQRQAIDAAVDLGYYDIPRTATHDDVAGAMGCAPSTAAEHLQKAESKLLRSVVDT
jgi:predicted DNA binding protein